MASPKSIFISYAHKDESYLNELRTFLKPLIRNKTISIWTDKDIVAGQKWDELIKTQLANSRIILFLVSPDFLASDYINDTEITNVLQNETSNSFSIVPIIIRPVNMQLLPLKAYQVIPTGAKAVSEWDSRDKAWNDVLAALITMLDQLPENGESNSTPVPPARLSSKIVLWMFVLLIAVSIVLFIAGIVKRDAFFCYTSLGGIGAGIAGFFMAKKV